MHICLEIFYKIKYFKEGKKYCSYKTVFFIYVSFSCYRQIIRLILFCYLWKKDIIVYSVTRINQIVSFSLDIHDPESRFDEIGQSLPIRRGLEKCSLIHFSWSREIARFGITKYLLVPRLVPSSCSRRISVTKCAFSFHDGVLSTLRSDGFW